MSELNNYLQGNFVVCDLGSSGKEFYLSLDKVLKTITLIELDAAETNANNDLFFKRITFRTAIAGKSGKRIFHKRKFLPCSSLLQPDQTIISTFGLEDYFTIDDTFEIDCITLDELLKQSNVPRFDFLKIDLEGLDCEILLSSPNIVRNCLAIQCELRFQPLYKEEPEFYSAVSFLRDSEFELISIKPEIWKHKTSKRDFFRDGQIAWGDFIFFLSRKRVLELFGERASLAFCKQIIIAKMLGFSNYALYIFEQNHHHIPSILHTEIEQYITSQRLLEKTVMVCVNKIASNVIGQRILSIFGKNFVKLSSVLTYNKDLKHIGTL